MSARPVFSTGEETEAQGEKVTGTSKLALALPPPRLPSGDTGTRRSRLCRGAPLSVSCIITPNTLGCRAEEWQTPISRKQWQPSRSAHLIKPWKVDFFQGSELRKSSNRKTPVWHVRRPHSPAGGWLPGSRVPSAPLTVLSLGPGLRLAHSGHVMNTYSVAE